MSLGVSNKEEQRQKVEKIGDKRGYDLQYTDSSDSDCWLTWSAETTAPEQLDFASLFDLSQHPIWHDPHLGRPRINFLRDYPQSHDDAAVEEAYDAVRSNYTSAKGLVKEEQKPALFAVRDALFQQIERDGKRLGGPLAAIRDVLKVLTVETAALLPTTNIGASFEEESELLKRRVESLWESIVRGGPTWRIKREMRKITDRLDTPRHLADAQWRGTAFFLGQRDKLIRPIVPIYSRWLVYESMAQSAMRDEEVAGWGMMRKDLLAERGKKSERDRGYADDRLKSAKKSVALALLVPSGRDGDAERLVMKPKWEGERVGNKLFKAASEFDLVERKPESIKKQITDDLPRPLPKGKGPKRWVPLARQWAEEFAMPDSQFEEQKDRKAEKSATS